MKKFIEKIGTTKFIKKYLAMLAAFGATALSTIPASAESEGGWESITSFIVSIRDNLQIIGYTVGTVAVIVLGIGIFISSNQGWSEKFKEGLIKCMVAVMILSYGPALIASFA